MKCARCDGPAERSTDERETWLCPRCGVWLHPDGVEIGEPVSVALAQANYEKFVIDTAAKMVEEAEKLKGNPANFAPFTITRVSPVTTTSKCTDCLSTEGAVRWHMSDGATTLCPECLNKRFPKGGAS